MASSSRVSRTKYDVFISFRGTDVRPGILSHLKKELQQKHIDFYVDERLERGDEISETLVRAIEESAMSLIIFSKDYASSKWCLEELVKITQCINRFQQIVFPVFYNTDPSDVRHQKGSYGDAFAEHDKNCKEKVQIWRSALNKAANLSGFHSANYKNEAELVEQVAKSLSTKLNRIYLGDSRNNLVGIDEKVEELETLMHQGSQDVRLIGIWGMGGIGKTTIASVAYHRFCSEYEGYYFQANVREESQKQGIIHLKKKIYEMLLKEKDLDICTPNGLPLHIERKLGRTKILLILDDINDSDQLECLVGKHDFFGPCSRIIITTRDKEVLNGKVDKIYEVKPLKFAESLELFNLNAFKENCLDFEWIKLSKRVIEYAKELPLALKVLGSFFRGKSKDDWKSQMEKLKRMPFRKINDVLRLSYDSLDRQQKNIFLYIACCFKGYERGDIIALLDACGFSTTIGLTVLLEKALITIESSEMLIVSMHDLIEEMGKEIVREESIEDPGKRSLLWDLDDIYEVLQNNTGTETIQSIFSDEVKFGEILSLNPQVFARMHKLKFLKMPSGLAFRNTENVDLGYLPYELRFLHWHYYPLKSLPMTFSAKYLFELDLSSSKVEKLWDWDEVKPLGNLKYINLSQSWDLVELPNFSSAKNLEVVQLPGCRNLCRVHPSIFSLPKFQKFDLTNCRKLTSLGSNDVHPKFLGELILDRCTGLKEFSVTSENMIKLDLAMIPFKELPIGLCLRKLEYINLFGCECLTHLPSNFVELTSLRCLRIVGCKKLASLPQLPPSIEQLQARCCSSLESVQFTSKDGDPLNRNLVYIELDDCMKLDEHSSNAVEFTAHLNLRNYAFKALEEQCKILTPIHNIGPNVTYPGSEVPKRFKYRTSQDSKITITPHSKLLGFILCMILGREEKFKVHIFLANNDDEIFPLDDRFVYTCGSDFFKIFGPEHVRICYVRCSEMINERIEESSRSSHNITYNPKLSLLFDTSYTGKCGVIPIYANEEEKEEDKDSMVDEDCEEDEIEAFPPAKRLK